MLTKITYPTGGYSEFDWESHLVSYENVTKHNQYTQTSTCWAGDDFTMYQPALGIAEDINSKYPDADFVPVNIGFTYFSVKSASSYAVTEITQSQGGTGYIRAYLYRALDYSETVPPPGRIPFPTDFDLLEDGTWLVDGPNIPLESGIYFLFTLVSRDNQDVNNNPGYIHTYLQYNQFETIPYLTKHIGGVRIKSITNFDGISHNNDIVKNYIYKKDFLTPLPPDAPEGFERSSLHLFLDPYDDNSDYDYYDPCTRNLVLTSYPVSSEGEPILPDGSHVGYSEVTEIVNGGENGITTFKFRNGSIPGYRSQVTDELYYNSANELVKSVKNTYTESENYFAGANVYNKTIKLLKAYQLPPGPGELPVVPPPQFTFFDPAPVSNTSYWLGLKSVTETEYFENDISLVNTKVFEYNGAEYGRHTMPTKITSYNSDGSISEKHMSYSADFYFESCLDSYSECNILREETQLNCLEARSNCLMAEESECGERLGNCIENNNLRQLLADYENCLELCSTRKCKNKCYDEYFNGPNGIYNLNIECLNVAKNCRNEDFLCEDEYVTCFNPQDFQCKTDLSVCQQGKLSVADDDVYAILKMQDKNIKTITIEETEIKKVNEDSEYQLISSNFNTFRYYVDSNNPFKTFINPFKSYGLSTNNKVNSFETAHLNEDGSLSKDALYESQAKSIQFSYSEGNLIEYTIESDRSISFYWSYNNNYPIVKADNATNSALTTAVNNAMTAAGITDYSQIRVPSLNASYRDQLKTFNQFLRETGLPEAIITSYTYDPLIGMTSETDPKGVTTYYEYDSYGRLSVVRDNDLNIIQTFDYHYQTPTP
ncbi:MAG: hypothetical protein JXB00_10895 [Bacteroidales bacterium]|nr:hypothetical protein [Bacteroidales bacterium]